jgi:hypothetical protein
MIKDEQRMEVVPAFKNSYGNMFRRHFKGANIKRSLD